MRIRQIICTDDCHKKKILTLVRYLKNFFMLNFQDFLLFTLCFFHFERQTNLKYPEKKIKSQKSKTKYGIFNYFVKKQKQRISINQKRIYT